MKSAFNRKRGQAHLPYREITRVALSICCNSASQFNHFQAAAPYAHHSIRRHASRGTFVIHPRTYRDGFRR